VGRWSLTNIERIAVSPWGTNHELEIAPLLPGHLFASTVLLTNRRGEWQSLMELFATLQRTVTVQFAELHVINDGDPHATANVQISYEISEGDLGQVVWRFVTPFQQVSDPDRYALPAHLSHEIGPKPITEDTQTIGIRVAGQDEDSWIEGATENAASSIKRLVIPKGRGKETVNNRETTLHAHPTDGDLEFEVTLKYSVKYA
jgi:hypothetical protein